MNGMTDRMTPCERQGQPDCLVAMGLAWLSRPLGGITDEERGLAIAEICLIVSQMRHRDQKIMEGERRRWLERVTVRLCQQCGGMRGYDGAVLLELERRMTAAMLQYHDWREKSAPKFGQSMATGPSDGGEVAA